MHNELFTIGGVTIYGYGLMIGLGVVTAMLLAARRARAKGLDVDALWSGAFLSILGGIIGAKLFHYVGIINEIIRNPSVMLDITGGFVLYGGVIGGVLTAAVYCKVKKLPLVRYLDLAMPSVALAQGFGRIGCFLAGCCHGKATDSWFHVVFETSKFAPNGVWLLPTQLMSSAGDFAIMAVLLFAAGRQRFDGQIAALYCLLYGLGRFVIEFARADATLNVGAFSVAQIIALAIVAFGGVIIMRNAKPISKRL